MSKRSRGRRSHSFVSYYLLDEPNTPYVVMRRPLVEDFSDRPMRCVFAPLSRHRLIGLICICSADAIFRGSLRWCGIRSRQPLFAATSPITSMHQPPHTPVSASSERRCKAPRDPIKGYEQERPRSYLHGLLAHPPIDLVSPLSPGPPPCGQGREYVPLYYEERLSGRTASQWLPPRAS